MLSKTVIFADLDTIINIESQFSEFIDLHLYNFERFSFEIVLMVRHGAALVVVT